MTRLVNFYWFCITKPQSEVGIWELALVFFKPQKTSFLLIERVSNTTNETNDFPTSFPNVSEEDFFFMSNLNMVKINSRH